MSTDTETQAAAHVMLLGTYHFQDAGLDWYKPQHDMNILSNQRQQEIHEVVSLLTAFEPTKIAVERRTDRQDELNHEYLAYLQGDFTIPGNEVYQLGFRLAKHLGHQYIYSIDAWGRYYTPSIDLEPLGRGRTTKELNQLLEEQFSFDATGDIRQYAKQYNQEQLITNWEKN
jgi:hypothetical protein